MNERELFIAALHLQDTDARAAFLDQACKQDPSLRSRMESLLLEHNKIGNFLEKPAVEPVGDATRTHSPNGQPPTEDYVDPKAYLNQVIAGKYKLIEAIGEGGMGSVFMAQQTEPVNRLVAVKLIKPGMDSKAVLARFEAERQALAVMDHPNIAKILDGGLHENRPFFVMELVKGIPITKFCDDRKLSPKERLELFVPVCQAIQHAHQKGIIHRDIKPSNVLIALYDDKAVPKVIDFGVAKATGQQLTDASMYTGFGAVVGTPEYMSPEQANFNNLDIDTRSDVYALGVLLYELLAGSPPFRKKEMEKIGLLEIFRVIREEEPPRPSEKLSTAEGLPSLAANRGTEPKKLTGILRNELDWIVMKALEKDRTRRYETVNGFAADVNRYLAGEAVQAHPPSIGYRLKKFLRRNRGAVVAASLVTFALLAGVIGTSVGLNRALDERRQADEARQLAVSNENKANLSGEKLREARDELWSNLYAARSNLIQNAWNVENVGRVRELLAEQIPQEGEKDLRGFEWHYWDRLTHAELCIVALQNCLGFGAISPDGMRFVGYRQPQSREQSEFAELAGMWDVITGELRLKFEQYTVEERKHLSLMGPIRFSPDGRMVYQFAGFPAEPGAASTSFVCYWDSTTGKRLYRIPKPDPKASHPILTNDGQRLLSCTTAPEGGKARLLARERLTGKDLYSVDLPANPAADLAISLDGSKLAISFEFGTPTEPQTEIGVWSVADGKKLITSARTDGIYPVVVFSPDGSRIVAQRFTTLQDAQPLTMWDVATGKEVFRVKATVNGSLRFSPDGRLLSLRSGSVIEIRDAATGQLRRRLRGHDSEIADSAFTADSTRLHSVATDGTARIWDATQIDDSDPLLLPKEFESPVLTVSGDGNCFASLVTGKASKPNKTTDTIAVCDRNAQLLAILEATVEHPSRSSKVWVGAEFSYNGRRLAYSHGKGVLEGDRNRFKGQLVVWDVLSQKSLFTKTERGDFSGCTLSPNGKIVASVFRAENQPDSSLLIVWEVDSGREWHRFDLVGTNECCLTFAPDGTRLVVYRRGSELDPDVLTSWDLTSGKQLWERITPGLNQVWQRLAYSADGRHLARSFSKYFDPGVVELLDAETGQSTATLRGHATQLHAIRFSPDGKRIASSDITGIVKIWDTDSGRVLLDLKKPEYQVLMLLGFTADGNRLLGLVKSDKGFGIVSWDGSPRADAKEPPLK